MNIKNLSIDRYEDFVTFNHEMYPERKKNKELIQFRVLDAPDENDIALNIIMIDDNNNPIGQILYNSTKYYHKKKIINAIWSFDLIIKKEFRKYNYGLDLLEYTCNNRPQVTFATGIGDMALKIEKAFGSKVIGHLKKTIKIINPINFLFAINRTINSSGYPLIIKYKDKEYIKINNIDQIRNNIEAYNPDMIEFSRDLEFLNWRFFKAPNYYALYKAQDSNNYFVVRTIIKKYITALVLVDYRCNLKEPREINEIINIAQKLTHSMWLPVLITGSSNKYVDEVLNNKHFKVIGRDRPITINRKIKEYQELIDNREFIFTTLADSDGELNW